MLRKNVSERKIGLSWYLLGGWLVLSTSVMSGDYRLQFGVQAGQFRFFDRGVAEFLSEAEGVSEIAPGIFLSFEKDVDFPVIDRLGLEGGYQRKTLFDSNIPNPFTDLFSVYRFNLNLHSVFPVNKSFDFSLTPILGYGIYRRSQKSELFPDVDEIFMSIILGVGGNAEVELSSKISIVAKMAYEYFQNEIEIPEPPENGRIGSYGSIIEDFNGFRIGFGVSYAF